MVTLYISIGIVYQMFLLLLYYKSRQKKSITQDEYTVYVSIIIPFRDEEKNLETCLTSISKLSYSFFEVICIDDHSTDQSRQIIQRFKNQFPDIRLKLLSSLGEGKKAAVNYGVKFSEYDVILTTDADCVFPEKWLQMMLSKLDSDTLLVAGPIMSHSNGNFLEGFQQIDWASIALITRFAIYNNRPIMCSAANMMYKKEAFLAVDGYQGNEHILSGDDEFLLKKIARNYGPKAIRYQESADALVYTQPMRNWSDLIKQRVRWASKWNSHGFNLHAFASMIPFLTQLVFFSFFLLPFFKPDLWLLACLLLMMKVMVERFVLGSLLAEYGIGYALYYWFLTSLIHPYYVLVTGIQTFFQKIEWKGRISF